MAPFRERLDRTTFATWLQDSVLVALNEATAVVAVPQVSAQERIRAAYVHDLAAALATTLSRPITLEVGIGTGLAG